MINNCEASYFSCCKPFRPDTCKHSRIAVKVCDYLKGGVVYTSPEAIIEFCEEEIKRMKEVICKK